MPGKPKANRAKRAITVVELREEQEDRGKNRSEQKRKREYIRVIILERDRHGDGGDETCQSWTRIQPQVIQDDNLGSRTERVRVRDRMIWRERYEERAENAQIVLAGQETRRRPTRRGRRVRMTTRARIRKDTQKEKQH